MEGNCRGMLERYKEHFDTILRFRQLLDDEQLRVFFAMLRGGVPCCIQSKHEWDIGNFALFIGVKYDYGYKTEKCLAKFATAGSFQDRDEKMRREVATMHFICNMTSIPVPRVHHWGLTEDNPLGTGPFIVMDYVKGVSLADIWVSRTEEDDGDVESFLKPDIAEDDLRRVYRQVSSYLLELADHPFQYIGSLSFESGEDRMVLSSLFTSKMEKMDYMSGIKVGGKRNMVFKSSAKYFRYILDQNRDQLDHAGSVVNAEDARLKFVNHEQMEAVFEQFSAPFGDVHQFRIVWDELLMDNIVVKSQDDLTIIAMMNWECCYAAPYQMFSSPPHWLLVSEPMYWTEEHIGKFSRLLEIFLEELHQQEDLHFGGETPKASSQHSNTFEHELHKISLNYPKLKMKSTEVYEKTIDADDNRTNRDATNVDTPGSTPLGKISHETMRMPPPPDPRGQRLSVLMREHWESGRFWFHVLLQGYHIGADCMPWQRLTSRYPHLKQPVTIDEAEADRFVQRKLKDFEGYEEGWKRLEPEWHKWWAFLDVIIAEDDKEREAERLEAKEEEEREAERLEAIEEEEREPARLEAEETES